MLVTQGALHACDLALRTLARPGDRVLVETPTYPSALDAMRAHGCVPVGVPVGPDGWDLATSWPRRCATRGRGSAT